MEILFRNIIIRILSLVYQTLNLIVALTDEKKHQQSVFKNIPFTSLFGRKIWTGLRGGDKNKFIKIFISSLINAIKNIIRHGGLVAAYSPLPTNKVATPIKQHYNKTFVLPTFNINTNNSYQDRVEMQALKYRRILFYLTGTYYLRKYNIIV